VQRHVRAALDACAPGPIRVISICAGQGRDVIGALAGHARADDVRARLVELHPDNVAYARATAPPGVDVVLDDASDTSAYSDAVPADVVLACGIFGNVRLDDIRHTIETLPSLCAPDATVLWTRHRKPPDRIVQIRAWFAETGFDELAFEHEDGPAFAVGVNRLRRAPDPYVPGVRMFEFVGFDALRNDPA